MTKLIICIFSFLISHLGICQTINELTKTLDSLKSQRELLQNRIDEINSEISKINRRIITYYEQEKQQNGLNIYTKYNTNLYEESGIWTNKLAVIPPRTALVT